jgi:endo-1,4-beta-xylanase
VNNKSLALLELSKSLLAQGHPLDGIGFESHFVAGTTPKDLSASMKQFTDLGLDVAITELDIRAPVDNRGVTNSTWLGIQ